MVVGEDLGTVPDYVRRVLAEHGVLGTDVEWFDPVDDYAERRRPYMPPSDYRRQALASVTTHDLPPTAGYLNFAHVKLREGAAFLRRAGGGIRRLGDSRTARHAEPSGGERLYLPDRGG